MQSVERLHSEPGGPILENKEQVQRLAGQMLHVEAVIDWRSSEALGFLKKNLMGIGGLRTHKPNRAGFLPGTCPPCPRPGV
jgi:hypothetical protein